MWHAWTFETAATFWSRSRPNPERAWEAFLSAERYLLDHPPRTAGEAARVLEVLVHQAGERRDDGRDIEALGRVRRYLQRLDRFESGAAATTRAATRVSTRQAGGGAGGEKIETGRGR